MAAEANAVTELATALYVGDLDVSVTEEELCRLFSTAGDVVSVKICIDEIKQQSLGYGYVNYSNPDDAEKALELLNFTRINGKCIRIAYSNREGTHRKSGQGNIFVKNLDKKIDHKALFDIFSPFGKIISCKVESDDNGESKGYGYVQFKNEEDAEKAIHHLNGATVHGKALHAAPYISKQEREASIDKTKFTNVFVKNISPSTGEDELRSFFGVFGAIASAAVMRDEEGRSRCFGFVSFERPEDAARAVEEANGKEFEGKELYVGRAQRKWEREEQIRLERERLAKEALQGSIVKNNLYIKNIDDSIDREKLEEVFAPFGTITSCKVMTDAKGLSRGYGFVAFSTPEEAARAIAEMNGKMVGSKPLYVSIAERKEVRHQRLQSMFMGNMHPAMMVHQVLPPPLVPRPPPVFFGNIPQPGLMFEPRLVPRVPILPNFVFPVNMNVIQRPGPVPQVRPPPPYPVMPPPPMHLLGFRGLSGGSTSQAGASASSSLPQSLPQASALANASPIDQKRMLGMSLYPLVEKLVPDRAGRVTDMLMEMDQTEVLHLLESPDSLKSRVDEVMNFLSNSSPSPSRKMAHLSLN